MKAGFAVILVLAAGALAAHLLLEDNGYVLVSFRGHVVEMSVPVLAFLLLLAYMAVRLLVHVWLVPRRLGQTWAQLKGNYFGRQATKGYIALAEGKLARGERLLTRGARFSETPLLSYLAAARAAQMQGDHARRDGWLDMAREQVPAASHAVLLTQAELQLEDGQYAEAQASLARVREMYPDHPQALKLLGEVHYRQCDWPALAELLPQIRKRGNVPAMILDRWTIDACGHRMADAGADRAALDAVWQSTPRHLRRNPELVAARARGLVAAGAVEEAEGEIRRVLREALDEPLLDLYGRLETADPAAHLKRIEAWLAEHPENPALLLAAGRACVTHQLWGKARSYIEASLSIRPAPAAWHALGRLMTRLGDAEAAHRAFEQGLALSAGERAAVKNGNAPRLPVVRGDSHPTPA